MNSKTYPAIVAACLMGAFFLWLGWQLFGWLAKHGFGAKWLALLD